MIITGAMPEWRRWYHFGACGFMCLLFVGFALLGGGLATTASAHAEPLSWLRIAVSGVFAAGAVVAIAQLVRGLSSIVREFCYDGATLRFSTLGASLVQVRPVSQITNVEETAEAGRGPGIGYRLEFRDGGRLFLDCTLTNVDTLVRRLHVDVAA